MHEVIPSAEPAQSIQRVGNNWTALMRGEKDGDPELLKIGLKASELLGKAQQDFIARSELTGANGTPLHAPDIQLVVIQPSVKIED